MLKCTKSNLKRVETPCNRFKSLLTRSATRNKAPVWAWIAQSLQRLAIGWPVGGSNPGGAQVSRIRPEGPWVLHSLLYNKYRVYEVKRPGRGVNHLPESSAEVKERTELYKYSPSVLLW
jgi:hypothetical protein